jgi:CheY-like chemotaxis protein
MNKQEDHIELYKGIDWSDKTIMIVDDQKTTRQYYQIAIDKTKAKTLTAKDGEEAIEIVKSGQEIDLILMDINMPNIDGLTATRIIKKLKEHTIIIVQTAYVMAGEKDRSYLAGCDAVIFKPIKIKELLKTIKIYLK